MIIKSSYNLKGINDVIRFIIPIMILLLCQNCKWRVEDQPGY